MANLTADSARTFEALNDTNDLPAAAASIFEGEALTINSSGYANRLVYTQEFVGFCDAACDNSAGSAGDLNVRVRQRGIVKLSVTGATAATHINDVVYATDGNTFTITSTSALAIGKVARWISSGVCMVYFEALTLRNLTSIGVATGTSLAATGAITSSGPTSGIGYATGAGGAVTQTTDRSTGVTLDTVTGAITTDSTSLAAGAEATFTVTNSTVAVGDTVIVSLRSGATANTSIPVVSAVAAGSFNIRLTNLSAGTADTGASIINFAVIKAVGA